MNFGKAILCLLLLCAVAPGWSGHAGAAQPAGEATPAAGTTAPAERPDAGAPGSALPQGAAGAAPAAAELAQAPAAGGPQFQPPVLDFPAIKKVGPGIFRIGPVQIHKQARSVTFPAQVNMDRGLLEYLLVQSSGKTHESLLRTTVDPYILQLAFLLLGFEGTDRPALEQGSADQLKGEPVTVSIHWRRQGESKSSTEIAPEDWLTLKRDGQDGTCQPLPWVYTGSRVAEGKFLAQVQGSIIALYHDSAALIDHTLAEGASDEIWFAREGTVPKPGTPVIVVIKQR